MSEAETSFEPVNKRVRASGITTAEAEAERVCYHAGGPVDAAGRCLRCGFVRPQPSRAVKAVRPGDDVTDLGGI